MTLEDCYDGEIVHLKGQLSKVTQERDLAREDVERFRKSMYTLETRILDLKAELLVVEQERDEYYFRSNLP